MRGEALTTVLMHPYSSLRTEGEPHPNVSKVKGLIHLRLDGGRGPVNGPNASPQATLGTGGEPHPNMSKVEDLIHLTRDGRRGPVNDPNVPP